MSEFESIPETKPTRELLVDHPIFFHAQEFEKELDEMGPMDQRSAYKAADIRADKLNLASMMDSVFGKPVRMVGENMVVPMPLPDYKIGSADIVAAPLQRGSELDFSELAVNGGFFGFTPYIIPTDETRQFYQAHIGYQVAISETIHLPTFYGTLLAFSGVSETSLEFEEDKQFLEIKEATRILDTVTDERSFEYITEIDSLMAGPDKYDYNNLRRVGALIRQFLGNKNPHITEKHRDALLDLAKARLELYTDEVFYIHAVNTIEKTTNTQPYNIRPAIEGNCRVKALSYAPFYWNYNGDWQIHEDMYALSVVIEVPSAEDQTPTLINVPFEKLYDLRPSGITNPNFIR